MFFLYLIYSMALELPPNATPDREKAILDYITQGTYEMTWATLTSDANGHHAEFNVFADALKIEGVRINVSAQNEQTIADMLGCMLLTPKLADLIWIQRDCTIKPFPRPITATTQAMIAHSSDIDNALAKLTAQPTLVSTVGKHWVLDNDLLAHPGRAENYGWHFTGNIGIPPETAVTKDPQGHFITMIQGRGWAHDMHEVDYSQTCVLVSKACKVDGQDTDLATVLQDPTLCALASHNGPLKLLRQPGVPEAAPL